MTLTDKIAELRKLPTFKQQIDDMSFGTSDNKQAIVGYCMARNVAARIAGKADERIGRLLDLIEAAENLANAVDAYDDWRLGESGTIATFDDVVIRLIEYRAAAAKLAP